ncbi:manganese transporter [bacterium]|nr:manganese transporter [bacterium]
MTPASRRLLHVGIVLGVAAIVSFGCAKIAPKKPVAERKVNVVATTGMVADLAREVGGDRVEVTALMGAGVDPHLYRASAGDVQTLSNADVIFYNGLHLEAKMGDVLKEMNGKILSVPVGEGINKTQLRSPAAFKGYHDPHVWFDVSMWAQTVNQVRDALIKIDPTHKGDYERRADAYRNELLAFHQEVIQVVSALPKQQRVLVTAHDAFGYFGRAYGFEVLGLQGISTESEAGAKDVQRLADFIAKRKIKAIFVESSVPKRNVEAVQAAVKSRGWDVKIGGQLFSDAMGNPGTPEGKYVGMVRYNVKLIVGALGSSELKGKDR